MRIPHSRTFWLLAAVVAFAALLALGAGGRLPLAGGDGAVNTAFDAPSGAKLVPPSATSASPDQAPDEGDGMTRTNLEGDEVSPALATYGIDQSGNLFEVHSPQTEVPKLPGPTT